MPLSDMQKPKRKPQEVQFTTPSKRAVHLAGQSDSDEELEQASVPSMDTDSEYSPGHDSASVDSPMSLTSFGIPTRTHHLVPPPPNHGFPQHSRLSLALPVVPPKEGKPPPMPTHVQLAWEASGRDLQGLDEPMWVDEKDWDE